MFLRQFSSSHSQACSQLMTVHPVSWRKGTHQQPSTASHYLKAPVPTHFAFSPASIDEPSELLRPSPPTRRPHALSFTTTPALLFLLFWIISSCLSPAALPLGNKHLLFFSYLKQSNKEKPPLTTLFSIQLDFSASNGSLLCVWILSSCSSKAQSGQAFIPSPSHPVGFLLIFGLNRHTPSWGPCSG